MKTELIDRIYEASFVPELWPGVLDALGQITDASGGLLFAVRDKVLNWTASQSLEGIFQSYVHEGWFARCDRRVCLFGRTEPSFLVEHDFWTNQQLDANPIYRDFFRPRGLGWSAGTGLLMPTGDKIVFSVERAYERGPLDSVAVAELNEVRPHLARAAFISARLNLQNAKGASDTLGLLGLPAVIVDEEGAVIEANALMAEHAAHVNLRTHQQLTLADARANALLQAALPKLAQPGARAVHSFPVRGADGRAALVSHVIPIKRAALDIFGRSYALLILTPVTARRAPPVDLLRSMFDLTPAEARVARGLANGDSLDDIAASGNVGRNTVRTQLQQVLEKIGCSRQAEVTALLSNMALGADPG